MGYFLPIVCSAGQLSFLTGADHRIADGRGDLRVVETEVWNLQM